VRSALAKLNLKIDMLPRLGVWIVARFMDSGLGSPSIIKLLNGFQKD
jgi:hypothetical protein